MTTLTSSFRDDVTALALGLGLLAAGAVALIGGSGLAFWIAGMH
ncbi:MAG TPA: hypothetical protein VLL76_08980 [Candidatus Omnitrophota bacterium]|nr:hypothetical protein [Candidatus Omnitrophota bacterium]